MVDAYIQQSNAAENGHRIQVTSEPDNGIYDAMNKGLRSLDGDYVCFLNAGDFLPASDTVSRIVEKIDQSQLPAVLYGDTDIVDGEGRFLCHRRLAPPEHLTWKSFRQGMLVCHQAFYARTDFAIATPYDTQYRYSADVGQLYGGGTDHAASSRIAVGALPCDGTALWPCADLPVARLVCSPFAFQIRKAPSSPG